MNQMWDSAEGRLGPAAQWYAAHGWDILPCYGIISGKCTCGGAHVEPKDVGKHPSLPEWNRYATSDSSVVAQWWEKEINEEIPAGRFGENLTTEGIDVNAALIGEQWKIGSVILEVSQPRIPCRVFAGFWKRATLIKDFTQAGRPGTYLRIIQEGSAQAGDLIEVIFKPDHTVTISDLFAAKGGERSKINQIKDLTYLSTEFKEWSHKIAATQN